MYLRFWRECIIFRVSKYEYVRLCLVSSLCFDVVYLGSSVWVVELWMCCLIFVSMVSLCFLNKNLDKYTIYIFMSFSLFFGFNFYEIRVKLLYYMVYLSFLRPFQCFISILFNFKFFIYNFLISLIWPNDVIIIKPRKT